MSLNRVFYDICNYFQRHEANGTALNTKDGLYD
jgi:hypothetical protein